MNKKREQDGGLEKIEKYLDTTMVGSVELIAFSDALEWKTRSTQVQILKQNRNLSDRRGIKPDELSGHYESRQDIEDRLTREQTKLALVEHAIKAGYRPV